MDSFSLGIYGVTNTGDNLVLASEAQDAIFAAIAGKDKRIAELEGYIKEIETIHAICIRDKNYYRNQAKALKHQQPTEE